MNCIENAYGTLYLSEERAEEFISITSKHLKNLFFELKENDFVPCHISLDKVTVRERKDINDFVLKKWA